jgi:hypothetical protein
MKEVLSKAGFVLDQSGETYEVNVPQGVQLQSEQPKPRVDYIKEIKQLAAEYKLADSQLAIAQVKQKRSVLRAKVKADGNVGALKTLLQWEKSRKLIKVGDADDYLLNELEMNDIPENRKCTCIRKLPGPGIPAVVGRKYKYTTRFDQSYKNKATKETGNVFYTFYMERTIERRAQISRQLAEKMAMGFMPKEDDFAKERVVIEKRELIESEFDKYFEVEDKLDIDL